MVKMVKWSLPEILDNQKSVRKMTTIDLKDESNLLPNDKLKVSLDANKILRKTTTVQTL